MKLFDKSITFFPINIFLYEFEFSFFGILELSTDINQSTLAFLNLSKPLAVVGLLFLITDFIGFPKFKIRKSKVHERKREKANYTKSSFIKNR